MQRYLIKDNGTLKNVLFGTKSSRAIINAKKNKSEIIKVNEFSEEELQFYFDNSVARTSKRAVDCEPFINELNYNELPIFIALSGIHKDNFLIRHIIGLQRAEIFKDTSKHLKYTPYNDYFNMYYIFRDGKTDEEINMFDINDYI